MRIMLACQGIGRLLMMLCSSWSAGEAPFYSGGKFLEQSMS